MDAQGPGGLTRLAESLGELWREAVDSITESRLRHTISRLPPDDEFSSVSFDTLYSAHQSVLSDADLTEQSSYERTAVMGAAAAFGASALVTVVLTIGMAGTFLTWAQHTWESTSKADTDTHATRFVAELVGALDWPGPWLSLFLFALLAGLTFAAWTGYRMQLATLDDRLNTLARPLLREFVNVNANVTGAPALDVTRAPGLTQISPIDQLVDRPEVHRIRRLITELGANSVAISGSRGSGKTTLLRNITHEPGRSANAAGKWLQIHVAAPVGYDSQDFLIHLYIRLCESVRSHLHFGRGGTIPWLYPVRRCLRFVVRSFLTLTLIAVIQESLVYRALDAKTQADQVISAIHRFTVQQFDRIGIALPSGWLLGLLIAALLVANVVSTQIGRRSPYHGVLRSLWGGANPRELAGITDRNLARLRFLQTTNSTWSGSVKTGKLDLGWGRSRQLAEVPLSLPELVDSYRNYVSLVAQWWRPNAGAIAIAITIDEMDRISDPSQAERFLNDIKAIFNIPRCVYLVSVSEDALSGFESRVVHMRTAMDSSFDEVVRLPPFTLEQSLDLIRRRVVGFPDVFTALCHCVSGGVPRDLVRAARSLVELRRDTEENQLVPLANGLVDAELASLRRGLTARLAHDERAATDLLPYLAGDQEQLSSQEILAQVLAISNVRTEQQDLADRLAAGLQYFATVLELFEGSVDLVDSAIAEPTGSQRLLIDQLARTRATLQFGPTLAMAQLEQLRGKISL
ncbi:hypothetical protein [Kribbella soli]|uniref:Uncharacterized protein n=1 Tax=Kribbella soli TaxID=1124743 RepID=A0A4R0HN65_9ACTN|nr:hypothetical protein [Kribbella soli]TCC11424.1 hypothetical protein E0H45_09145 [Kribbella soli]